MQKVQISTWKDFQWAVQAIREGLDTDLSVLFRGQGDALWSLATTLERAMKPHDVSLSSYLELIVRRVKPSVETFVGTRWPLELGSDTHQQCSDKSYFDQFPEPALYEYMVYLRHHGFPSPLLDWSTSANVAAFFAFREPLIGVDERAIYMFWDAHTKLSSDQARIRRIGPYVRSHRRHFSQKSDYTICARYSYEWFFDSHERALERPYSPRNPTILWKFVLPSSMRIEVLEHLDSYGLSAFTMFDTDESLLETLWLQNHDFPILENYRMMLAEIRNAEGEKKPTGAEGDGRAILDGLQPATRQEVA